MEMKRGFAFRLFTRLFQLWLAFHGIESYLSGPLNFLEAGYKWEVDWTPR